MLDAAGNETKFTYDAANRLLRQTSSDGSLDKSYGYDTAGHIASTTNGGVRSDYSYDARGNVTAKVSSDSARGYEVQRNAGGAVVRLAGRNGNTVSFEYDAAGNETAFTSSEGARFESEFDASGHMVIERMPSGVTIRSEYDVRGKLTRRRDNRGHSLDITRDASGTIIKLASSSGSWVRAERDVAGRITALTNSSGRTRRFAYDARGSLVGYTDALGRRTAFDYNSRGCLRAIDRNDGVSLRLDYDRVGRLIATRRIGMSGGAVQFLSASFSPSAPFGGALAQTDPSCLFGGDSWFEGDTFNSDFGMGCDDPFGGFGDGLGGDGFYNTSDDPKYDCAKQVVICLAAIAAYIGGISALIAACGPSLGLGCIGALLVHPILGAVVAFECSDMMKICNLS